MGNNVVVQLSGPIALLASLSSVCALLWGVWTYKRNAAVQLQLLALEKLQHYLDLAITHPDLASRDESQSVDVRYAWFAAQALTTAQTLWLLVGRQSNWQRSINAIVRQHHSYLRSGVFVCDDFSPDFVGFLRTRVAEFKCAESNDAEGAEPPTAVREHLRPELVALCGRAGQGPHQKRRPPEAES